MENLIIKKLTHILLKLDDFVLFHVIPFIYDRYLFNKNIIRYNIRRTRKLINFV